MIDYHIKQIKFTLAKEYIKNNHYSHGCHNGASPCFGLYDGQNLIGVLMFATPCSEMVRSSIFGEEYKQSVIELHRLHILDGTPKNTESWFISRCLKLLKEIRPHIWAVLTFADQTEGHNGTIYKATNALRLGASTKRTFYLDETGRLRHPRQSGKNISKQEAEKMGWTPVKREGKFRFMWLLPDDKRHKKELNELSKDYIEKHSQK
ncbi:Mom family adenine methylcarbamoylation protein [Bacillus sp. T33-2]|uniref:Mom family adenine methylcarbamoylation protein n=1 Tax=Bacillus sp. T33-2 TaxID=2054168 RepID=UPI000C790CB4|nr:hypothetical protein [Bacillus sp. T33-2]PLR99512.1 hypothetical protein CVD19_00180 [Bacillus sp. T33-2]